MSSEKDKARARAYYQAHKKEYREYVKKNPHIHLRSQLKNKYQMTLEEYTDLLHIQQGRCAICKRLATEFSKALAVDHDHQTGAPRGLLCPNCNHGLGRFQDNIEIMMNAVEYLRRHTNGPKKSS